MLNVIVELTCNVLKAFNVMILLYYRHRCSKYKQILPQLLDMLRTFSHQMLRYFLQFWLFAHVIIQTLFSYFCVFQCFLIGLLLKIKLWLNYVGLCDYLVVFVLDEVFFYLLELGGKEVWFFGKVVGVAVIKDKLRSKKRSLCKANLLLVRFKIHRALREILPNIRIQFI